MITTEQRIEWLRNLLFLNKVDMVIDDVVSSEITGQLTLTVTLDLPTTGIEKGRGNMTDEQFKQLRRGDIVRNVGGMESYVVTATYRDRVTAVRTVDLTNPEEWELTHKANLESLDS